MMNNRVTLIEALVDDDLEETESCGFDYFERVLQYGFKGYNNFSTYELEQEYEERFSKKS